MNKIMKFHYFDQKRSGANVPSILGLTASPVKKFDDRLIAYGCSTNEMLDIA